MTDSTPSEPAAWEAEDWFGRMVAPGDGVATSLVISENFSGSEVTIPIFVYRGVKPGPTLLVTAAVHGDEINGAGAIRHIIRDWPFRTTAGTLVLVPVVNMPGFERHTRYLPDRRDLNRSFPGSAEGSAASRMAWSFFDKVVRRCDYCIDLHTAAVRRTNYPNVRADMTDPRLAEFARAFGSALIVDSKGPKGSLRAAACRIGRPTLILEAGEVWKVEPAVVEYATQGIANCLKFLGMIEGERVEPPYRIETDASKWVRAQHGGFLEFHIAPGDIIESGDPIATNTDLTGEAQNVITAPRGGVILGMTTMPSVAPGDPICHIAFSKRGALRKAGRAVDGLADDSLHGRVRDELARNVRVTDPSQDENQQPSDS